MTTASHAQTLYQRWLNDPDVDLKTKEELSRIADQQAEIEDRFYKDLEFGTGGLRGVIGAGTNRMNEYTVGRVTQGLAEYILASAEAAAPSPASLSAVIAYDSRHMSPEFALEGALVFAANGIKAYVFESLRPTPELSFAVRELKATAGVVVTASHNPPEYNGYKVYGQDGGQLTLEAAGRVISYVNNIKSFDEVRKLDKQEAESRGLLEWIGADIDRKFIDAVTSVSQRPDVVRAMSANIRIVFTPLHGAGNVPVREALKRIGFDQVHVVARQEQPDPQFSTVASPNPEEREAFTLAIEEAKQIDADIIVGTDPDSDRMGACVKDANGEYVTLSGNQTGALLLYYLLEAKEEQGTLPSNGVFVKTIVSSELGAEIAASYGIPTVNTLTGFKFIGEKVTEFETSGKYSFVFGYEESYGYLAGTHARDKDAVVSSMLICEAAAFYKSQGKTLQGVLHELYIKYGFHIDRQVSITLKGIDGIEKIRSMMQSWRDNPPQDVGGTTVIRYEDYNEGLHGLPKENVLKFYLADGSWFCVRPSGTEPKIKFYFAVKGDSQQSAEASIERLVQTVMKGVE